MNKRIEMYFDIAEKIFAIDKEIIKNEGSRNRLIVFPRAVIMFLIRQDDELDLSLAKIGSLFKGRTGKPLDHATVLHHIRRCKTALTEKINGKSVDPKLYPYLVEAIQLRDNLLGKFEEEVIDGGTLWVLLNKIEEAQKRLAKRHEEVKNEIKLFYESN